jgi:hypothetical protein
MGPIAKADGGQFPAQCLLGDDDAEFLEDPLAEVDDPPAHDAMHGRDRAALEYRAERGAGRAGEETVDAFGGRPRRHHPAILQNDPMVSASKNEMGVLLI